MPSNPDAPRRDHTARAAALIIAAILVIMFMAAGVHLPVLEMIGRRLYLLLLAVVIVGAATGVGLRLLDLFRAHGQGASPRILLGAALGMGVFSFATLLLGLLGLLYQPVFVILVAAGAVCGGKPTTRALKEAAAEVKNAWPPAPFELLLWLVIFLVLCMNLLGAFAPPWAYDDLTYHLGAPARFFRMGRIAFLSDNVYSNFPENVETWYLASMVMSGSALTGAFLGKLINILLGIVMVFGIHHIGERFLGRGTGTPAAAFFYVSPFIVAMSSVSHVEIPLMFYSTAALCSLLAALERRSLKSALLCGVMAGLACGCKLPALLLVLAPVCVDTSW